MKAFNAFLIGVLLFAGAAALYSKVRAACAEPIRYSLGAVDPRFKISEPELLSALAQGEAAWEQAAGRELFTYDPEADFKVNLIYDERQERTEEYERIKSDLEASESEYKSIEEEYEALLVQYDESRTAYDTAMADFESDLSAYNEQVEYWNSEGGAPEKEYAELNEEQAELDARAVDLEEERGQLNVLSRRINEIAEEGNNIAKDYNSTVSTYNTRFGTTTEFDQGDYRGSEINIYQFKEFSDLRMVAAHEFGHALGLGHVDDPIAIMYHFMGDQDLNSITLSSDDQAALFDQCRIER